MVISVVPWLLSVMESMVPVPDVEAILRADSVPSDGSGSTLADSEGGGGRASAPGLLVARRREGILASGQVPGHGARNWHRPSCPPFLPCGWQVEWLESYHKWWEFFSRAEELASSAKVASGHLEGLLAVARDMDEGQGTSVGCWDTCLESL